MKTIRLRMLTSLLCGPTGPVYKRGHERDVDEETAAILLATRQWEVVRPPEPEPKPAAAGDEGRPDAEWTDEKAAAAEAPKQKRRVIGVK